MECNDLDILGFDPLSGVSRWNPYVRNLVERLSPWSGYKIHIPLLDFHLHYFCFFHSRDQRDSRWSLGLDNFCSVSAGLGLDNHRNSQSRWVSVSTTTKFPSLDESWSRQPQNFPVSMSLGLDNHRISQSRWVSVSTTTENHAPIHLLRPAGYFFPKNSMTFCKNRNNFINFGSKQGKFRY